MDWTVETRCGNKNDGVTIVTFETVIRMVNGNCKCDGDIIISDDGVIPKYFTAHSYLRIISHLIRACTLGTWRL